MDKHFGLWSEGHNVLQIPFQCLFCRSNNSSWQLDYEVDAHSMDLNTCSPLVSMVHWSVRYFKSTVKPVLKSHSKIDKTKILLKNGSLMKVESTVKPVLSSHSKKAKIKVLITNGSLMKVESIAECSPWSILQYI